jgi:long-chain fatty acid transport protein
MISRIFGGAALLLCLLGLSADEAAAQTYGTDLHNVAQPASGGMAGVSLAAPQDAPSALFGNPSTMTQFRGTVVTTGLNWLQPTLKASHDGAVTGAFGGGPWSGTSQTQGFLTPSVAVLQDLRPVGIDGNFGLGLTANSGLGTNFRNQPASVGTGAEYMVYNVNAGLALEITDRLSVGAAGTLGLGLIDIGFAQTSAMTHAYAPRGTFGFDYDIGYNTTLAAYYQTQMPFTFNDLTTVAPGVFTDTKISQPDNIGFGVSNQSLCDGRLLLAADILYKRWNAADFWGNYYQNQWAFAVGAQYTHNQWKYRTGYAYATNPIDKTAGDVGGPIGQVVNEYFQATELAAISKHRLTAGLGYCNILPGLNFDMYAGGLLRQSEDFGAHSHASAFAWYAGAGLTWFLGPAPASEPRVTKL